MIRILELVGLLAPLAGLALLIVYRRTTPRASLVLALSGCALAMLGVLVGFLGRRALPLGSLHGGGFAGMADLMSQVSLLRLALLGVAAALLAVAALQGRPGRARRSGRATALPWLAAGAVLLGIGLVVTVPVTGLEHELTGRDHEGLALLAGLIGETVEFATLGLGILALTVAVTTGRRSEDAGTGRRSSRDPAVIVVDTARSAWATFRTLRR